MSVNKYRLKGMPPRAMAFSGKPEAREPSVMEAEKTLSDAYLRLRAIIPGAFDTPYGPSPEVVWQVTEKAAERLKARAESAEREKQILDDIRNALESRGFFHMTNGESIGQLLDELEAFRANEIADAIRKRHEFQHMLSGEPQNG